MKPGNELDSVIAEKVMKLQKIDPLGQLAIRSKIHEAGYFLYPEGPSKAKPYSTDKSAAMLVVEKINEDYDLQAKFHTLYDGFNMQEIKPGDKIKEMRIDPFEICRAALEAVEYYETR